MADTLNIDMDGNKIGESKSLNEKTNEMGIVKHQISRNYGLPAKYALLLKKKVVTAFLAGNVQSPEVEDLLQV